MVNEFRRDSMTRDYHRVRSRYGAPVAAEEARRQLPELVRSAERGSIALIASDRSVDAVAALVPLSEVTDMVDRVRVWSLEQAQAHLSDLVRAAGDRDQPTTQVVTRDHRPVAALICPRLLDERPEPADRLDWVALLRKGYSITLQVASGACGTGAGDCARDAVHDAIAGGVEAGVHDSSGAGGGVAPAGGAVDEPEQEQSVSGVLAVVRGSRSGVVVAEGRGGSAAEAMVRLQRVVPAELSEQKPGSQPAAPRLYVVPDGPPPF